eukprot:RCo048213
MGTFFSKRRSSCRNDTQRAKKRAAVMAWLSVMHPDVTLAAAPPVVCGRASPRGSEFSDVLAAGCRETSSVKSAELPTTHRERRLPGTSERICPLVVCPDLLQELAGLSSPTPESNSTQGHPKTRVGSSGADIEGHAPAGARRFFSGRISKVHSKETSSFSSPPSTPRSGSMACMGNPMTPRSPWSTRSNDSRGWGRRGVPGQLPAVAAEPPRVQGMQDDP